MSKIGKKYLVTLIVNLCCFDKNSICFNISEKINFCFCLFCYRGMRMYSLKIIVQKIVVLKTLNIKTSLLKNNFSSLLASLFLISQFVLIDKLEKIVFCCTFKLVK